MRVKATKSFRLETTPGQLRALADRLEKWMSKTTVGDDIPREMVYGVDCECLVIVDQEAYYDEVKRTKG